MRGLGSIAPLLVGLSMAMRRTLRNMFYDIWEDWKSQLYPNTGQRYAYNPVIPTCMAIYSLLFRLLYP